MGVIAQHITNVGGHAVTISPEWATILVTLLLAITGAVLGQLKASWDIRSDLKIGLVKIENLEKRVGDHEERIRKVEMGGK